MIGPDVLQLVGAVFLIVAAVLPVVNPLGDAPIFLYMTEGCDELTRSELSRRISIYSFFMLLGSMLLGSFVLRLFGLSIPIVQVAGGLVVCSLGWNLLTDKTSKPGEVVLDSQNARRIALGRAFYPLTLPLTIDAGVISVAVTVGANHAHNVRNAVIQILAAVLGSAIVGGVVQVTYRYAAPFSRWVGNLGMVVTLRLSAFITLCIGVSICWSGIKSLLAEIGWPLK